jgi:hypothetical protein
MSRRPHSRPSPRLFRRAAALLSAGCVAAVLAGGCGRKVNDGDCRKVADHLGEVWAAEAKREEVDGPGKEKAADAIRQEGERLTREWVDDCKKELVGRRVEEKELACLLATKTMADIQKCAEE